VAGNQIQRFLGGSPGSVLAKLIFLSILVGAALSLFGLTPPDIIRGVKHIVDGILSMGTEAIREVLRYLVYGAVIVVPIWLVMRLISGRG
jgi:hypothetical protein